MMTASVAIDLATIVATLSPYRRQLKRVGHEAGALEPWLHPALAELGLPIVCLEARRARAAMAAQRDKTDALGLAYIVRTGWYRAAHIKTEACYRRGCCSSSAEISSANSSISRTRSATR